MESSEICVAHLRRIRSLPKLGELKYDGLLTDMKCLETQFNFKMLPERAKTREAIKVFTEQEAINDLVENDSLSELYNDNQISQHESVLDMSIRDKST